MGDAYSSESRKRLLLVLALTMIACFVATIYVTSGGGRPGVLSVADNHLPAQSLHDNQNRGQLLPSLECSTSLGTCSAGSSCGSENEADSGDAILDTKDDLELNSFEKAAREDEAARGRGRPFANRCGFGFDWSSFSANATGVLQIVRDDGTVMQMVNIRRGKPAASYRLPEGRYSVLIHGDAPFVQDFELRNGRWPIVKFDVQKSVATRDVYVAVTDFSGEPIKGASLIASATHVATTDRESAAPPEAVAVSDELGKAVLRNQVVVPNAVYTVHASGFEPRRVAVPEHGDLGAVALQAATGEFVVEWDFRGDVPADADVKVVVTVHDPNAIWFFGGNSGRNATSTLPSGSLKFSQLYSQPHDVLISITLESRSPRSRYGNGVRRQLVPGRDSPQPFKGIDIDWQ